MGVDFFTSLPEGSIIKVSDPESAVTGEFSQDHSRQGGNRRGAQRQQSGEDCQNRSRGAVCVAVRQNMNQCRPWQRRLLACLSFDFARHSRYGQRSGFTLTEVLIVAVVLGVLMSLITAVAFSALTRGNEFAIQAEVGKLALAMEAFKQQYGSYPPANLTPPQNNGSDRLYNFISRAFPRYVQRLATNPDLTGDVQTRLRNDLQRTPGNGGKGIFLGDAPDEFNPAHALMFWLVGFSNDPADPFAGHRERMKGDDLAGAFYDFNPDNIGHAFYDLASNPVLNPAKQDSDATLTAVYIPNKQAGGLRSDEINQTAVLYFDSTCYAGGSPQTYEEFSAYTTTDGREIKPRSFQMINAGLDRKLGSGGTSRGGEDADNVVHFSRRLMGDE